MRVNYDARRNAHGIHRSFQEARDCRRRTGLAGVRVARRADRARRGGRRHAGRHERQQDLRQRCHAAVDRGGCVRHRDTCDGV